jgi:hypothetical protein
MEFILLGYLSGWPITADTLILFWIKRYSQVQKAPLALVEPVQLQPAGGQNQHRWLWALLVIRLAPLAGCPHLLADGKGYASGYATLAAAAPWGVTWGFLAKISMAAPQGPVCNIRLLIVHRYAPGIKKSGAQPCTVEHFGRRGKPVKKMRLIPAEKAFAFARRFQGLPGVTVSVC